MGGSAALRYAAPMPTPFDHAFAVLLMVLFPIWDVTLGFKRLRRAPPSEVPRMRLGQYQRAIAVQWTLVTLLLAWWALRHRAWSWLGLVPQPTFGMAGVALGTLIVIVYIHRERSRILGDDEALAEVRHRLDHVHLLMPRTPRDMRWFFALSFTAGVCEEILYRGFLWWYFQIWLGAIPAAIATAVVFGVGHSYQGWRGVLQTGAAGAFLAAVYLLSGSLVMPMLLHVLMDLHSGHLGYAAFSREDARLERERVEALRRQAEWERAEEASRRREAEAARESDAPAGAAPRGVDTFSDEPTESDDAAGL